MSAPRGLRRPIRVGELLLPAVLALAGRGPVSAENFLTLLASREHASRDGASMAGTRVTAPASAEGTNP